MSARWASRIGPRGAAGTAGKGGASVSASVGTSGQITGGAGSAAGAGVGLLSRAPHLLEHPLSQAAQAHRHDARLSRGVHRLLLARPGLLMGRGHLVQVFATSAHSAQRPSSAGDCRARVLCYDRRGQDGVARCRGRDDRQPAPVRCHSVLLQEFPETLLVGSGEGGADDCSASCESRHRINEHTGAVRRADRCAGEQYRQLAALGPVWEVDSEGCAGRFGHPNHPHAVAPSCVLDQQIVS
jgi:hypothetical protein